MSDSQNPAYPPLIGTLSVLFLSCGVALSILMIVAVTGPFRFMALSAAEASLSFGLWSSNRAGIETQNRIRAWREVAPRGRPLIESDSLLE